MYEDLYRKREAYVADLERATGTERLQITRSIAAIDRAFSDRPDDVDDFEDPLVAKWEREIAEGRIPDLTEGLTNAKKKRS